MRPLLRHGERIAMTANKQGFTLIELLIVIVIISVVATFATLSININQNKRLENIANQLTNILTLAETEALLRPATLGFVLQQHTFRFYIYHTPKDPAANPWKPLSDSTLGLHHIPNDVQMTLKIRGEAVSDSLPNVIFSPSGDVTPFVIFIGKKDRSPRYKIIGTENGTIKNKVMDEEE